MPRFVYIAKTREGKKIHASREADSIRSLVSALRQEGSTAISVSKLPNKRPAAKKGALFSGTTGRVKLQDVATFCRQLTAMLEAGLPIVDAVESLSLQAESLNLRKVLNQLRDDMQAGKPFSQALVKHPKIFSFLFVAMVQAGEESGALVHVLGELASYLEDQLSLRKKVRSASAYPVFVACFLLIVLGGVVFFLIPKFQDIFSGFGAELPLMTLTVMKLSRFAIENVLYLIGGIITLIFLVRALLRTRSGRYFFDRMKLKFPIFGKLLQKVILARFTRSLASLLASGVSIISALRIVSQVSGNLLYENVIKSIRNNIIEGSSIAQEMNKSSLFPPMLSKMVSAGEESGTVSQMLNKTSRFFKEEVDATVSGLTSILEPLLIVILGGVAGIVVISLYLPIFRMVGTMH